MTTTFFATRTLARNAAADLNGKVKDFGSTAESGKRWGVVYESEPVAVVEPAKKILSIPAAHAHNVNDRSCTMLNKYKKPVQVTVKRSKTACLLAANIAYNAL